MTAPWEKRSSSAPTSVRVRADVRVEPLRLVAQLQGGQLGQRGVAGTLKPTTKSAPAACSAEICGPTSVLPDVYGRLGDDLVLDELLGARRAVLAEVVVLEEQADLGVGELLGDVLADDLALALVVGLPAEGVRVALRVRPSSASRRRRTGRARSSLLRKSMTALCVGVPRPPMMREHLVLEDELVDDLRGVGRVVGVVADDPLDRAGR